MEIIRKRIGTGKEEPITLDAAVQAILDDDNSRDRDTVTDQLKSGSLFATAGLMVYYKKDSARA